jgi:hypothetical protein
VKRATTPVDVTLLQIGREARDCGERWAESVDVKQCASIGGILWLSATLLTAWQLPVGLPIRVHIVPPVRGEFIDFDDQGREDSVKDLRRALVGMSGVGSGQSPQSTKVVRRYPGLSLVDSPKGADLLIEVVGRRQVSGLAGSSVFMFPNGAGGVNRYSVPIPMFSTTVGLLLSVGDHVTPIVGVSRSRYWRMAAEDAAEQINKWVTMNRAAILKRRGN